MEGYRMTVFFFRARLRRTSPPTMTSRRSSAALSSERITTSLSRCSPRSRPNTGISCLPMTAPTRPALKLDTSRAF